MKYLLMLTVAGGAMAQEFQNLIDWSKFESKADETVNVNLDGMMLQLAKGFVGGKDGPPGVQGVVQGLRGVFVRSFKFDRVGGYAIEDVNALRAKVTSMQYQAIVDVRSNKGSGDNTSIYVKTNGEVIDGLVVIAAEPRELTVVHLAGNIDPSALQQLGGKFGIPNVHLQSGTPKPAAKKQGKDEEDE
ncbi:MAG: DUF4252 domain-containing protein [Armatimonadetes bacterium]|nr:DUF4252 domain-containing protein [Armatimonadota bacterium]MBM3734426.1 DUF4252 domain-containing protein [Acidobacteriota bacterium]